VFRQTRSEIFVKIRPIEFRLSFDWVCVKKNPLQEGFRSGFQGFEWCVEGLVAALQVFVVFVLGASFAATVAFFDGD
jgi:hypothetical protein